MQGKKTYLTAAAMIAYAWLGVFLGNSDANHALEMTLQAAGLIFLRNAVTK